MKVLVVCTGNKYRSPIAAAMLRKLGVDAVSVGLSPYIIGSKYPPKVRAVILRYDPQSSEKGSKRITADFVKWADCILYMQPSHHAALLKLGIVKKKIFCLGKFANSPLERIPDPGFNNSVFDDVVSLLYECVVNYERNSEDNFRLGGYQFWCGRI